MTARDPRYSTARWQALRRQAIRRDGNRCAVSGCRSDMSRKGMVHADHIIEARDGGPFWELSNIQVLCELHHNAKTLAAKAQRPEPRSPNG